MQLEMTQELTELLITKGAIRLNTEIDADYTALDIAGVPTARTPGNFTIMGAKKRKGIYFFEARNTLDGSRQNIDCREIKQIDGMTPSRFAEIFGLTSEGATIKQGKRRGRKPRSQMS